MALIKLIKSLTWNTFFLLFFILSPILSTQEVAAPGLLYVICIIVPAVLYVIVKRYISNFRKEYFWGFAFLVTGILSTFVGAYGQIDSRIFKQILFFLFYLCISSIEYNEKDIKLVIQICIYISIIIASLIIFSWLLNYPHLDSVYYKSRYSIGITGLYKNPNYLASFMNTFFFFTAYKVFCDRSKILMYCFFMGLILFADYLTGTRAAFITIVIALLFIVLQILKEKRTSSRIIMITCIAAAFIVLFSQFITFAESFAGNKSLFVDEERIQFWGIATSIALESPIIGNGLFSWENFGERLGFDYLHNIFLEIFLNQGIIGVALAIKMTFYGYKATATQDKLFLIGFFVVSGFPLFFQNGLIAVNFWRYVILCRFFINYSKKSPTSLLSSIKTI